MPRLLTKQRGPLLRAKSLSCALILLNTTTIAPPCFFAKSFKLLVRCGHTVECVFLIPLILNQIKGHTQMHVSHYCWSQHGAFVSRREREMWESAQLPKEASLRSRGAQLNTLNYQCIATQAQVCMEWKWAWVARRLKFSSTTCTI
jgi:hypothetical protein